MNIETEKHNITLQGIQESLERASGHEMFSKMWAIQGLGHLLEHIRVMEQEIMVLEETLTRYRHLSPNDIPDPKQKVEITDAAWALMKAREARERRK